MAGQRKAAMAGRRFLGTALVALSFCAAGSVARRQARADTQAISAAATDLAIGGIIADELASTIGIGLSPVLGLAMVSAWSVHVSDPPPNPLRWYHSHWFILPLCFVLALILAKDTLGVPLGPLKQPLDAVEVLLAQVSGVLGLAVTVSKAADSLGPAAGRAVAGAWDLALSPAYAAGGGAAVEGAFHGLGALLAGTAAGACYVAVALLGQTFSVLVFLNPFSPIDPVLKGLRIVVIGCFGAACVLFPPLGIFVCLLFVAFCWWMAGYCVRWMSFGALVAFDVLFRRGGAAVGAQEGILAFAASGLSSLPERTLGRLVVGPDEAPTFRYRRWLVLPRKDLPISGAELYAIEGALHPVIGEREDGRGAKHFDLPPRYRGQTPQIAATLRLQGAGVTPVLAGWRHAMEHFRGMLPRRRGDRAG